MSDDHTLTPQEQSALVRYGAISYLQQLQEEGRSLAAALRQAALRPWPDVQSGKHYAIRTLEDWWYAYQNDGFQALTKHPRQDTGKQRALTSEQQEWILTQRRKYPQIPIKVAYRRWLTQGEDGMMHSMVTVKKSQ